MIEIKRIESGTKGYFGAFDGETEAGRMSYTFVGSSKLIIDHTEVSDLYKGQNIGRRILMEVVKYARENNIKIIPLCPFAKSVFNKIEEIRDVLN
jgi:uncharacterized protein